MSAKKVPNSRDIIVAAINGSPKRSSPEVLADRIVRALAAKSMHIVKARSLNE